MDAALQAVCSAPRRGIVRRGVALHSSAVYQQIRTDHAKEVELPEQRHGSYQWNYEQARSSWFELLSDHVLEDDGTRGRLSHRYYETPKILQYVRDTLHGARVLRDTAKFVNTSFRLLKPVTCVAGSCDKPNAVWNPQSREITLCYELMDYYADLIIKDIAER